LEPNFQKESQHGLRTVARSSRQTASKNSIAKPNPKATALFDLKERAVIILVCIIIMEAFDVILIPVKLDNEDLNWKYYGNNYAEV